jgi:hypothetical protein
MVSIFKINISFLWLICIFIGIAGCSYHRSDAPILVLSGQDDFGMYTEQILRAEGFNEFESMSLADIYHDDSFLSRFPLVIMSEKVSDPACWGSLERYVQKGGRLIFVVPSDYPESLFGIRVSKSDFIPGYIFIDTTSHEGKSLISQRIQVHAESSPYLVKSADVVVWFGDQGGPDNNYPAVVTKSYGKGRTAAFLYNLPANIVFTRQGNPENAGLENDGIPGLRAMDLFTDGWVDPDCNTINQADEQMHLLTNLINSMCGEILPLPRLWYFPDTLRCLVTLTNDGEYRNEKDFEQQFLDVDSAGAGMSLYVMQTEKVSKEWAGRWISKGFDISGHPDGTVRASVPDWDFMDSVLAAKIGEISSQYRLKMNTVVNHWFVWCGIDTASKQDFAAQALIEANHGIGLDLNYAHYDNNSSQGHFLGKTGVDQGNFTGSGLPMRFASRNGKVINIWQQLTNVYDQQYNENHDPDGFFECFKGLIDRSIDSEIYSFISIKSHNDEYYFARDPLLKMLKYSNERNIPVWTASRLLDFIKTRDNAGFTGIKWKSDKLSFTFESRNAVKEELSVIIPFICSGREISKITADGKIISYSIRKIRGSEYASVLPGTGENINITVTYSK